VIILCRKEKL